MNTKNQKIKVENRVGAPVKNVNSTNSNLWNLRRRYR